MYSRADVAYLGMLFQSTPPSQGATCHRPGCRVGQPRFNPRPPHRERPAPPPSWLAIARFNPRPPHRERPSYPFLFVALYCFNPRPPHRERLYGVGDSIDLPVSIHAPLTGSDGGGAELDRRAGVSIHAPLTGSDRVARGQSGAGGVVSIHAPLTGSDGLSIAPPGVASLVSIHAPLTGSDWHARPGRSCVRGTLFQSTPPSQGATIPSLDTTRHRHGFNPRPPH